MFNICLITTGKYKEKYWAAAEAEYLKRLSPYAKIKVIELAEEPFKESSDREKVKLAEAEKIQKNIPKNSFVIALHERGKQCTSVAFANFLHMHSTQGQMLTFIIGGPLGLGESILKIADQQFSLSELTFPHQMARIILLEQVYRAGTIVGEKTYHY